MGWQFLELETGVFCGDGGFLVMMVVDGMVSGLGSSWISVMWAT